MKPDDVVLLESLLGEIVQALTPALRSAELALEILAARKRRGSPARRGNGVLRDLIDDSRFTVRWNGSECHLGPTIPYRLLRRLATRPNHYVPHEQLIEDVWDGPRSASAIGSAVFELRRKLVAGGMAELAGAIDGESSGHYALRMDRIPAPDRSDRDPTRIGRRSDRHRAPCPRGPAEQVRLRTDFPL